MSGTLCYLLLHEYKDFHEPIDLDGVALLL